MAVNQERVNAVCEALDAGGKAPTLAAVREELGEGSFSTLARMVRVWKAARVETAPEAEVELPESVQTAGMRMLGAVWAEAEKMAIERLNTEKASMESARAEMSAELESAYAEMDAIRAELAEVRQVAIEHAGRMLAAEKAAETLKADCQQLQVSLAASRSEAEAYKSMLKELAPAKAEAKKPAAKKASRQKKEPEAVVDTLTQPLVL